MKHDPLCCSVNFIILLFFGVEYCDVIGYTVTKINWNLSFKNVSQNDTYETYVVDKGETY